ncbi:ABC transporter substrate-binding protein [Leifsonia sp. Root112D2]|uniref:ABC transporter substrate-binding protein n=1 Tax=Leifsonia sp. Root112D2 TaxID=1736426 RepID=UPI000AE98DF9|nr:ABC transporter substrate-binding protein [Leifsonia sp. Root112D2]
MKNPLKKTMAVVAVVAAAGLALSGCASSNDSGNTGSGAKGLQTVNVGIVQLSIFAPIYIAEAKGYFKDEGIKLNLQNVKSGQDAIPLASSGKLDVVAAGFAAGMFSAVQTGLDIKVVGSMGVSDDSDEPASALIVSKKEHDNGTITSVKDLKGKRIGALGGGGATSAFYVSMALKEAGLSNKDVTFVQLSSPDIPTAIKNGSIDGAFVSAPFWSNAVNDGTAVKLWQTPAGTSGTGVIYGGKFVKSKLAQPFFNAMVRASADLQGDKKYSDENMKIIAKATDQTVESLKAVPLYSWLPNLAPLPDQLADMEKVWIDAKAIQYTTPLKPSTYVDTTFADNAKTK